MNNEAEQLIAAPAANPTGARLLDLIAQTDSAMELHHLAEHEIVESEGLTDEERRGLQEAINLHFCVLNAAALRGTKKPRWT